jgi:tryptophan halogenase
LKNIIVVGGGTAGLMSALYINKILPEDNVIVIESSKIGIVGVGESTTPFITQFFKMIDIDLKDLIKNVSCTLRNGLKLTNWSKDKSYFYHYFMPYNFFNFNKNINHTDFDERFPLNTIMAMANDQELDEYSLNSILCELNKVSFNQQTNENYSKFGLHFNAQLLAKYLRSVAKERKINIIDSEIDKINIDQNGFIESLSLNNKMLIKTDFIVDATGNNRVFIGEYFKSEWLSYSESLPVDKAIPFFLESEKENIKPYTEAVAMNYGWMWITPLQDRIGAGYVFDSSYISVEEAKAEVEKYLGKEIKINKVLDFNPGTYKEVWIKNCLSVGLAAGFNEPMEATSIYQVMHSLINSFSYYDKIFNYDAEFVKDFNDQRLWESNKLAGFLYLIYMTDKIDNDFWKNFTTNNKMPEHLKKVISISDSRLLEDKDTGVFFVGANDYYIMMYNKKMLNMNVIKSEYEKNGWDLLYKKFKEDELIVKSMANSCMSHIDFLSNIDDIIITGEYK